MQGGLVVAVLAVVAAVALTAHQPPPPSIAEFAPQAVEQIKQAPQAQAIEQTPGRASTTTTTAPPSNTQAGGGPPTTAPVIDVPRVRRCVGDPPRQTEDPQSPPCVPYFDGNNGGATAQGVTADTIEVVAHQAFLEDMPGVNDLVQYFNQRFEFYGRKINLDWPSTSGGDPNVSAMQTDANNDVTATHPFAALNYIPRSGAEYEYYDQLARQHVISAIHAVAAGATDAHFNKMAPYEWSFLPSVDTMLRNYGQFVCAQLAGKPPTYAGIPVRNAPVRVFGLIIEEAQGTGIAPDPGPLESELSACHVSIAVTEYDQVSSSSPHNGVDVIAGMTNASPEVTSVICLCDGNEVKGALMQAAEAQAYEPEWLLGTYLDSDLDNSLSGGPSDQAGHALGVLFRNKLLPGEDMPFYTAIKEVDPGHDVGGANGGRYYALAARYSSLLLLASGIQLAGPHLTPETFQAGLQRARFANPGAGGPPYFQGRVGFEGGRHTMLSDGTMWWYDPNRQSNVFPDSQTPGAVCYIDHGRRYGLGAWPSDVKAFFDATNGCL